MSVKAINKINAIKKAKFIDSYKKTMGHITDSCRVVGINRTTYYNWLEKDRSFAMAILDSEADLNSDIRNVLIQKAAEGDMTAVIFYLKYRHPDFKLQQPQIVIDNRQVNIHPSLIGKYGNIHSSQGTTESNTK